MSKNFKVIIVTIIISVVINILLLLNHDINNVSLSNSFFTTSVILLTISGYSYVAAKGLFSTFAYSISKAKHRLTRPNEPYDGPSTLYEYREKLSEKSSKPVLGITLVCIGLIELLLAIIMTYYV